MLLDIALWQAIVSSAGQMCLGGQDKEECDQMGGWGDSRQWLMGWSANSCHVAAQPRHTSDVQPDSLCLYAHMKVRNSPQLYVLISTAALCTIDCQRKVFSLMTAYTSRGPEH